MPVNEHLQWIEVKDFTPGLWEQLGATQLIAPPNALAVCQDYMPIKTGGLRAAFRTTAVGTSGIAGTGAQRCTGVAAFQVTTRPGKSGGGTESFDALLTATDASDFKHRTFRMDQANDETTWKTVHASTAAASSPTARATHFANFLRTNGTSVYVLSMNAGNTEDGLNIVGYAYGTAGTSPDNVFTHLQAAYGPLCISQARILVGGGTDSVIHYSDVGDTAFTSYATQIVNITPNRSGSGVMIISPIEPDDLLIGKDNGPWVEVNGDLTSTGTPIREMGDSHHTRRHRQQAPHVQGGIAFFEDDGRIFVTDGRTFTDISYPIKRLGTNTGTMLGYGQMAYLNDLLFVPEGYVYDFETGAWFKQTQTAGNMRFHWANDATIWVADEGAGFDVKRLVLLGADAGLHASSGQFRTMPFADPQGRTMELREVQLFVRVYSTSTATLTVYDTNTNSVYTQTITGIAAGFEMVRFLIPNVQDDYLSADFQLSADNGTSEAPTVERYRLGFGAGNLVR